MSAERQLIDSCSGFFFKLFFKQKSDVYSTFIVKRFHVIYLLLFFIQFFSRYRSLYNCVCVGHTFTYACLIDFRVNVCVERSRSARRIIHENVNRYDAENSVYITRTRPVQDPTIDSIVIVYNRRECSGSEYEGKHFEKMSVRPPRRYYQTIRTWVRGDGFGGEAIAPFGNFRPINPVALNLLWSYKANCFFIALLPPSPPFEKSLIERMKKEGTRWIVKLKHSSDRWRNANSMHDIRSVLK